MTNRTQGQNMRDDGAERDAARVRAEYARRAQDGALRRYYDRNRSATERAIADRRSEVIQNIDRLGVRDRLSVVDVGCGTGADLRFLADSGFTAELLAGIDLLEERIAVARVALPNADLRVGNAAQLPYADKTFDVALQSVVLSSVTDRSVRSTIAREMARVVRAGGLLISYDIRMIGRDNSNLSAIDGPEVRRLFGSYGAVEIRTMTLRIEIAGRVGAVAAGLLGHIPGLRTHLLAVVERGGRHQTRD